MEYSRLKLGYSELPLNAHTRHFIWEGDNPYVRISDDVFVYGEIAEPQVGQVIRIGAYRVRVLQIELGWRTVLGVRENWLGVPRLYGHKLAQFIDGVYRRIILTMFVWGLAERGYQGYIPTWRDIKLVKWFAKWGKKS
jgi:hypothetical protein